MAKPGKLYERDFFKLNEKEIKLKKEYLDPKENLLDLRPMEYYPSSVRHNISLFPNNHIELFDLKQSYDLEKLNKEFSELIENDKSGEREILNFINHKHAYHIVGSILNYRFNFGHHECYLFKEFSLGKEYRTDYVIIGKGSGGYEFVLIEFERPNGRITLKNGYLGECFRKGNYQVKDWQAWMDANSKEFFDSLALVKGEQDFPEEFKKYDSTRFHYVVVSGRRADFSEKTYIEKRKSDILLLHYDNLKESAEELLKRETF